MEYEYKEVNFKEYCKICKHVKLKGNQEPCNECLEHGMNRYSRKPIKWEAQDK